MSKIVPHKKHFLSLLLKSKPEYVRNPVKPYECIPGPTNLPLIGNSWLYLKTDFRMNQRKFHKELHGKFGEVCLLRNVRGNDILFIYSPKIIEMFFRNEGTSPVRDGFHAIDHYRTTARKDVFKGMNGLIATHGENWQKLRSKVNPIFLKPSTANLSINSIDNVAEAFKIRIQRLITDDPQMPDDFENELYKMALELTGTIALNKRLGCFDENPSEEVKTLIHSIIESFKLMFTLDFKPYGKFCIKHNLKPWRQFVEYQNFATQVFLKYVNETYEKLDAENEIEESVFGKLLKLDKQIAIVMTLDMLTAGIDTTGKTTASILYFLAKNREVQNKLRAELNEVLPKPDTKITKEILLRTPYLRSVIKETLRIAPIATGILRKTTKDLVLGGYHIPAGINVFIPNLYLSNLDDNFKNSSEFMPERWLRSTQGELSYKGVNPFVCIPFGVGARSCIGRRFASLELEIITAKIIRNFELSWPHDEDMTFGRDLLYGVKSPLKLHVREIK